MRLNQLYKVFWIIAFVAICEGFYIIRNKVKLDFPCRSAILSANLRQDPVLVRAYKGEKVERTPVWFMRQAGRYMEEFRKYSSKYSFRERSETPDIAVELSLQPVRRFGVDGVIIFSDILTPLPGLGVDFSIIEGTGPKILRPLRSLDDINALSTITDVDKQFPFISPIIKTLRQEVNSNTAVIGFVGAPWTLAGYMIEGGHSKNCRYFKTMCIDEPAIAHRLLEKLSEAICVYASHQIASGAQIIQVFESWAYHLTEDQFNKFAKPYADKIAEYLKKLHPEIPLVYFANGGSCFLKDQRNMHYDSLSLDWQINMKSAREIICFEKVLAGNVDPLLLYCSKNAIQAEVEKVVKQAGNRKFVLNLGHGIEKDMPEESVEFMVSCCRNLPPPID